MAFEAVKLIWNWEKDPENEFYVKPLEYVREPLLGFKHPMKKVDGIYVFNDVINTTCIKELKIKLDDTFIIGYPKSGTTWVEEMVWQIGHKLDFDQAEALFHFARVPWVDRGFSQIVIEEMTTPRCFKSHLPIRFLPEDFNKKSRLVYVIRNPKDIVVSTYKFLQSMKETEFIGTLDDMVNLFVEGKTCFGPWWEHVDQFTSLENVHIIHYEELLENPIEITRGLIKYLGVDLNDDDIKKLIMFTSFDNMKSLPSMDLKAMDLMFKEDMNFFFKGQIGNWKNFLTEEQSKKIDEMVRTKLKYSKPFQYEPSKNE